MKRDACRRWWERTKKEKVGRWAVSIYRLVAEFQGKCATCKECCMSSRSCSRDPLSSRHFSLCLLYYWDSLLKLSSFVQKEHLFSADRTWPWQIRRWFLEPWAVCNRSWDQSSIKRPSQNAVLEDLTGWWCRVQKGPIGSRTQPKDLETSIYDQNMFVQNVYSEWWWRCKIWGALGRVPF